MYIGRMRYIVWIIVTTILGIVAPADADEFRIAVRAIKGNAEAMSRWQATADYLNQTIPQHHFTLVPFENNSALNQSISNNDTQLSITNPASSVELKIRYGQQLLATLLNNRQGNGYAQFGSVIFTRADRTDISKIEDLKGKIFLGVDELGFGGWRIAWGELLKHGVEPYTDFKELRFAGGNQLAVVRSVLKREVDAGVVRTDVLEGMASAGEIKLSDIKVLGAKRVSKFPFLVSTDLYPEWYFSASKNISNELKAEIARALLAINRNDPAAKAGHYIGWINPIDATPVEELLKELKAGPYRVTNSGLLNEFIAQYAYRLMAIFAAILALGGAFFYVSKLNRRFTQTQAKLKAEITNRERAEHALSSLAQQSLEFTKEELFFKLCLTELAQLFGAKYAFIGLFADADKSRIKTYAIWTGEGFVDNFEYALAGTPCQDVLNLNLELIESGAAQKYPEDAMLRDMGIESYFGAPLISPGGAMMGLVSVFDTKPMYPAKDLRAVLKIFANRIAMEIQRKREEEALKGMAEQLSYQASHDVLTNLLNRREFEVRAKAAWISAKSQHKQHALCYLDLDRFKEVNDAYGHQVGDALLIQISSALSTVVRGSDTLARLGGDEFGVLLLDCPLDRAREIANKLLDTVKSFRFIHAGESLQVGVSIGVVAIGSDCLDMHALFRAADASCYKAKGLGRNRIHIHGEKSAAGGGEA